MLLVKALCVGFILDRVCLVENNEDRSLFSKLPFYHRENKTTDCAQCGSHYDAACRTRGQYFVEGNKEHKKKNSTGVTYSVRTCPYAPQDVLLPSDLQNAGDSCQPPEAKPCDPSSPYYTFDGSCNNLLIPSWGQVGTPFARLVAANYSDGYCSLRTASNGAYLPLSRKIRTTVLLEKEIPSTCFNILYYSFGQWVDHDITLMRPIASKESCCKDNPNPETCLPTIIPKDDPFYSKFNVTCLEMTRATNTHHKGCQVSPCLPINFQTAFLDLSILYGTNAAIVDRLRSYKNGELLYEDSEGKGEDMFPPTVRGEELCPQGGIDPKAGDACMSTGDDRVNQNPELTIMEIIFMRAHNYIAAILLKYNPDWDDEQTFQETRRILIALYQHIVTAEHVPPLIGVLVASNYVILPSSTGYNTMYNPAINSQTTIEYSFGSGRAHHSMIRGTVGYKDSSGQETSYKLRDKFFNQRFLLSKNVYSNIMSVFIQEKSNKQDEYFTTEVSNWLFASAGAEFGFDLISIDIDRGRDTGMPPYNMMRQACGLCRLSSFEDMADEIMDPGDIPKLKSLYASVDDIDLYVGGLLEKPIRGSTVGATFSCIIGENFFRWKFGDRLFYEFPTAGFTLPQLEAIRKVTFAWLLCKSNPKLKYVPKNGFMAPSASNPLIQCDEVQAVDLSVFKD